jgi:Fe-S cluster assembly ATPase SufC
MAMLEPKFAIMDETDSGLDIDALRTVAEGVNSQLTGDLGALVITHYQRLLNYIMPDFVHVMSKGRVVKSGDKQLVNGTTLSTENAVSYIYSKMGYGTLSGDTLKYVNNLMRSSISSGKFAVKEGAAE